MFKGVNANESNTRQSLLGLDVYAVLLELDTGRPDTDRIISIFVVPPMEAKASKEPTLLLALTR